MKENDFLVSAGLVRVIAILGVVSIHVTDALVNPSNYIGGLSWWLGNIINSFGRTAVPLFIMLSGYLILNPAKEYSAQKIYNKAIFKIVLPLIFWSIFYFFWRQRWWAEIISTGYVLEKVLSGRLFHLYFLLIVIGLYFITPSLKKFTNTASRSKKRQIIVAGLLYAFLFTTLSYFFEPMHFFINSVTFFTFFIGYYLAGDYMRNMKLSVKKAGVYILSIMLLLLLTAYLNYLNRIMLLKGEMLFWSSYSGQYFGEYASPNVILMSLATFGLLINADKLIKILKNNFVIRCIKYFAATALGVYLIHPFIIDILDHFAGMAIHQITSNLWIYILEKIILVYVISHLIVNLSLRVKLLKNLFGGT